MIDDAAIDKLAKPFQWHGGRFEGWTFNTHDQFYNFVKAIYIAGQDEQRESDAVIAINVGHNKNQYGIAEAIRANKDESFK